jgi:hypothetical protein
MSLKDFDDFVNQQNKPLIVVDFTTSGGRSAADDIVDSSFFTRNTHRVFLIKIPFYTTCEIVQRFSILSAPQMITIQKSNGAWAVGFQHL